MKNNRKILIILIIITIVLTLSSCKKKESKLGEIAIVINSSLDNLDKIEKDKEIELQKPVNLQVGEIAYIKNIYENLAYVVLLRPMEPIDVDSVGYIPLENLKFDYSPEEIKEKSIYCHIIKDDTPAYKEPNKGQIKTINSQYLMIEKKLGNWVLVHQKGGAGSIWINEDDINYDFTEFIEQIKDN